MGFREDFRRGREQVRAARGETRPFEVMRPAPSQPRPVTITEPPPLETYSLEDERLQREIERLQRVCAVHGERYPGCPLDLIDAARVVGDAVTGTFRVGRWLLGYSPAQRERRREALGRALERAAERQREWERDEALKQQPRVRVTRTTTTRTHADAAIKRPAGPDGRK